MTNIGYTLDETANAQITAERMSDISALVEKLRTEGKLSNDVMNEAGSFFDNPALLKDAAKVNSFLARYQVQVSYQAQSSLASAASSP